ncbi:MAG: TonB-dependent receptor plug domain-containing protein, partial [Bacteroidetes bacterium]|nr:TonB-dependent receptor plug domain-containing protein [Bacteroidota bacterium]
MHPTSSICILIAINIFTFLSSFGQTITILDSTTNRALENIAVFNPKKTKSALSNNRGVIKIDDFDDNDIIIFQHPSYKTVHYTKDQLKKLNYKLHLSHHIRLLKEFVISASKFEEKKADIPFRMEIIDYKQIEMLNPQTSADVLQMTGKIMIQKSQMGGGSPVIRGFEANKILLVVDGVRMNNAIYRSGHLHNIITIDNAILDRTEIIFGPGSVVYGSDALGGVIHFYTKNPQLAVNDTSINSNFFASEQDLNAYIRYSSANNEQTTHFDFQLGFKKIGFLTSITHSEFGDLRMGQVRQAEYPNFGKVFYYAWRINGKDTILANNNPNIHKNTGYSQDNLMQKILYRPNEFLNFALNVQYSTSSDIPRFDRLNDTLQGGGLKFAEWYYGPQKRLFTSLNINFKSKSKWFDESNLVLAYQKIDEDRITRKFGESDRINR